MASIAQASEKPSKPSRLRQAREHLPTFLRPSKQKARASAQSDVQEHEDPPASGDLNLNLAKAEDPVDKPNQSLWDRAAGELGDECKYLRRVEEHLKLQCGTSPNEAVSQMLEKQHSKLLAENGVSQTPWRRNVRHGLRYISALQAPVLAVARLDPHGVAPLVLSGFFCLVQLGQGGLQQSAEAVLVSMEVGELIALWTCVEEQQIKTNRNASLKNLYEGLSQELVNMYKTIIVLLGKLLPFFDSKWRQALNILAPAKDEWILSNKLMKNYESKCKSIKEQVTVVRAEQERASTAMKWISSYDFLGPYEKVVERTKIKSVYKDRAQAVLKDSKFQSWNTPNESSVLWLRGTIGTGKSTLMARTVLEVSSSDEIDADPHATPAIFFFDKTNGADKTSVEVCFRSLTRQLSWDHGASAIKRAADTVHSKLKDMRPADSLTTQECRILLEDLLRGKEAYIMIDAIDECAQPTILLENLVILFESIKGNGSLHIMLCGRMRPFVTEHFEGCLVITTGFDTSSMDQDFYVETEIECRRALRRGSIFFSSEKNFPNRLKGLLKRKGEGLFRWIEIQIDVFTRKDFNRDSDVEKKLKRIDQLTLNAESDDVFSKEYESLLNDLGENEDSQEITLNMLRFIACSFWPLSATSLADAINASLQGTDGDYLTANNVDRLLAGFVREGSTDTIYQKFRHIHGNVGLQLAHTSVLEYLMDNQPIKAGFTAPAQHSEATRLCLAVISHCSQLDRDTIKTLEQNPGCDIDRQSMSDIFYYACLEWPQHCKMALATGNNSNLTERVRHFLLSDSHAMWNHAVEGLLNSDRDPRYYPGAHIVNYVWQEPPRAKPGFVIAVCDMMELLDDPEMQLRTHLSDLNGAYDTLFSVSVACSKRETLKRLLEVYSEEVPRDDVLKDILNAVQRRQPEAVERLLESCRGRRRNDARYGQCITLALREALCSVNSEHSRALPNENGCTDYAPVLDIIRHLLVHGANLFAADDEGRGMMHFTNLVSAQQLLIDHAKRLEVEGLRGSVQRILRQRDTSGQTPLDIFMPNMAPHLHDALNQALQRDFDQPMYDFESIDIPALRNGTIRRIDLMNYLLVRNGSTDPDYDNIVMDTALRDYREWLARRSLELKKQYLSEQRKIATVFHADSLAQELPDEWDNTEQRVTAAQWTSIIEA